MLFFRGVFFCGSIVDSLILATKGTSPTTNVSTYKNMRYVRTSQALVTPHDVMVVLIASKCS